MNNKKDVYSIAYKNELFANLTKGDFLLLKDAGVISDMTESKDGIFQDASDYFVINEAQFRLVAERRIVIIIEKEILSYIKELRNKVNVLK